MSTETQNQDSHLGKYDGYDYVSPWVRGESFHQYGRVKCYGGYDEWGQWQSITLDELKLVIDQPYYDPEEEARDRGWSRPCAWCFDFPSQSRFKNGITDRDRMRKKLQHRLKMRAARKEEEALVLKNKGFKPCRMKACNGRAHKAHIDPATGKPEKCPVMSGLGSKGGKSGTGASKARNGAKNGRSKGGPKKRTQTAARLKAGEINLKTAEVVTHDPFAYYQDKINGGA